VRKNAETKGRRYVAEGRLLVERVDEHGIRASCRGGGGVSALGHDGVAWFCSCPGSART
jgi:hypothetical protein